MAAHALSKVVATTDGSLVILKEVNLAIKAGTSAAILGVSGSGKSTLLGLLAGLDTPTTGQVFINGQDLTALDEDARASLRAQTVGFVFQSFQLLGAFTAIENVMLPLELAGVAHPRKKAAAILAQVGLDKRLNHYPTQLSGGEQQRVALARAFVTEPTLLFADEPTGNLDQQTAQQVVELMFALNQTHKTTLVLVTHDPKLAGRCDSRLNLQSGQLKETTSS